MASSHATHRNLCGPGSCPPNPSESLIRDARLNLRQLIQSGSLHKWLYVENWLWWFDIKFKSSKVSLSVENEQALRIMEESSKNGSGHYRPNSTSLEKAASLSAEQSNSCRPQTATAEEEASMWSYVIKHCLKATGRLFTTTSQKVTSNEYLKESLMSMVNLCGVVHTMLSSILISPGN